MIKSVYKIWKPLLMRVGTILISQARFKILSVSSQLNPGKVNQRAECVHLGVQLLHRVSSDLQIDRVWRPWMNIQIHLQLYELVICLIQLQRQTIPFFRPSKASYNLKLTKRLKVNHHWSNLSVFSDRALRKMKPFCDKQQKANPKLQ